MSDWIERIVTGLRSASLPDRERAAMWAASLFQTFTGAEPFDPSVHPTDADLEPVAIQGLSDRLEEDVRAAPLDPEVDSLVWALGKRFDPKLRPLFALVLAANLQGEHRALHQALVALDNLDEPALADVQVVSALDVTRNRELAYAVLGLDPADFETEGGRG